MPIVEIKFQGEFKDVAESLNEKIGKLEVLQINFETAVIFEGSGDTFKDDINYIKNSNLKNNSVITECKYASYDNISLSDYASRFVTSNSDVHKNVVEDLKNDIGSLATSQIIDSTDLTSSCSSFNRETAIKNLQQVLVDVALKSKTPLHEDDPINSVYNSQFISYSVFAIALLNVVASLF